MTIIDSTTKLARPLIKILEFLGPLAELGIRAWVAWVFFKSGLTKLQSMDSTITLFTYEYQVPVLSPAVAAYVGTFVELVFPILLIAGLAGRFSAGVLFIFNIIAVISYPSLNEAGIRDHQLWGLMLLLPLLYGPGKLSVDHFIRNKFMG
jgi:putative oxidoreductase